MTIAPLFQEIPGQVSPDSVSAAAQDAADSLHVVDELSREVGQAGRDLASGNLDSLASLYSNVTGRIVDAIPNIISAIFVFVVLYSVYRLVKFLLRGVLTRARRVDVALENLLVKSYQITGLSLISIMVIAQFGVNVTALIAGLSVVGIAVGFAAQDTIGNFISGITIFLDSPFRVGHFIEIEDVRGTVTEITLRSTRVRTLNNQLMVLPNNQMINQKLINHTALGMVRVEISFGIAYKEFPEAAREAVLKAVSDDPRLHPDFPPTVVVDKLNDSSIDMILRLYLVDPSQEVDLRFEFTERVREVLRKADIEIPFPHLQLHIDSAKGLQNKA